MADGSAVPPLVRGLSQYAIVTSVVSATQFNITIRGWGDTYFENWAAYVVRKADGSGAAPQGDLRYCTGYVSNTGLITINSGFSGTQISVGDAIMFLHPALTANIDIVVVPSNNIKQSDLTERSTAALAPALVESLVFTGKVGGARLSLDVRTGGAGTATAYWYKNGVLISGSTSMVNATGAYVPFTQDIYGLVAGDTIEVWAQTNAAGNTTFVRNFTIGYDILMVPVSQFGNDTVYIDTVNGYAGTTGWVGTAGFPVNNLTDALVIAANKATNKYHVNNPLILDQNIPTSIFAGDGDWNSSYVDLAGYDVGNSTFHGLGVVGSSAAYIYGFNCLVTGAIGVPATIGWHNGEFVECLMGSVGPDPAGLGITCLNCISYGNPYNFDLTGGGAMSFSGGAGDVRLLNMNNALCLFLLDAVDTSCYVDATCTLGLVFIMADSYTLDFSASPTLVQDYSTYKSGSSHHALVTVTLPANFGGFVVATARGRIKIDEVIISADGMATTADLNYIELNAPQWVNSLLIAQRDEIAVRDQQTQARGPWVLDDGDAIYCWMDGSGVTDVSFTIDITWTSYQWGAWLDA